MWGWIKSFFGNLFKAAKKIGSYLWDKYGDDVWDIALKAAFEVAETALTKDDQRRDAAIAILKAEAKNLGKEIKDSDARLLIEMYVAEIRNQ